MGHQPLYSNQIEAQAFFAELKPFVKQSLAHVNVTFKRVSLGFSDNDCMLKIDREKFRDVLHSIIEKANTQSLSCGSKPRFEISGTVQLRQVPNATPKFLRLTILITSLILNSDDSFHVLSAPSSPRAVGRKAVEETTSFRMNLFDANHALKAMNVQLLFYSPKEGNPNRAVVQMDFPLYNRAEIVGSSAASASVDGRCGCLVSRLSKTILSSANGARRRFTSALRHMVLSTSYRSTRSFNIDDFLVSYVGSCSNNHGTSGGGGGGDHTIFDCRGGGGGGGRVLLKPLSLSRHSFFSSSSTDAAEHVPTLTHQQQQQTKRASNSFESTCESPRRNSINWDSSPPRLSFFGVGSSSPHRRGSRGSRFSFFSKTNTGSITPVPNPPRTYPPPPYVDADSSPIPSPHRSICGSPVVGRSRSRVVPSLSLNIDLMPLSISSGGSCSMSPRLSASGGGGDKAVSGALRLRRSTFTSPKRPSVSASPVKPPRRWSSVHPPTAAAHMPVHMPAHMPAHMALEEVEEENSSSNNKKDDNNEVDEFSRRIVTGGTGTGTGSSCMVVRQRPQSRRASSVPSSLHTGGVEAANSSIRSCRSTSSNGTDSYRGMTYLEEIQKKLHEIARAASASKIDHAAVLGDEHHHDLQQQEEEEEEEEEEKRNRSSRATATTCNETLICVSSAAPATTADDNGDKQQLSREMSSSSQEMSPPV